MAKIKRKLTYCVCNFCHYQWRLNPKVKDDRCRNPECRKWNWDYVEPPVEVKVDPLESLRRELLDKLRGS